MSQYLADKVIIVTGAGSGFGRLIAHRCATGGARVVGVDVNADNLDETISGITAAGGQGVAQVADVTDMAQLKAAAARAVTTFGAIDVLVNNAGVMPLAFFADHERAWQKWHQAIDINIKGVVNGISAVYDQMMAQGRGQVVNISSIYGNGGVEGAGVYSATKVAVTALSDALRVEAQGRIKVTTVKPTGVIGTNLGSTIINGDAMIGILGQNMDSFRENVVKFMTPGESEGLTDPENIRYWAISPEELAEQIVYVIDQPWGISISDITVRASGDQYLS